MFHFWKFPFWRSNRLSPILDQEQEKQQEIEIEESELDTKTSFENMMSAQPSQQQLLVSKIQLMTPVEKALVLKSIQTSIENYLEVESEFISLKSFDTCLQDLISTMTEPTNFLDKKFLFYCYGLILRESLEKVNVKMYLIALLEMSHQVACQREGIALAVGLASSSHWEVAWAVLEQFGQKRIMTFGRKSVASKVMHDIYWKWASSTALLCYGQMAIHAKNSSLPWVDKIMSKMVYYFNYSKYDEVLKSSFLSATVKIAIMLKRENSGKGYMFKQIPNLIDCILIIFQKEPQEFFDSYFQQKSLQVISTLSSLQPGLSTKVKTKVLRICFESLFVLPATEMLAGNLSGQDIPPGIESLHNKTMENLDQLLQSFLSENETMEELQFLLQSGS
ncbi:maestro heat-like repeat family member 5 [Sminthopsis crassicaudata]|uniref:maestro heat-like repeat family member 5 n=1 Tax=Sminthopsis crassicaudata TaxID=9301 RepID=UPI003D681787